MNANIDITTAEAMDDLHTCLVALHQVAQARGHDHYMHHVVQDTCTFIVATASANWPDGLRDVLALRYSEGLGFDLMARIGRTVAGNASRPTFSAAHGPDILAPVYLNLVCPDYEEGHLLTWENACAMAVAASNAMAQALGTRMNAANAKLQAVDANNASIIKAKAVALDKAMEAAVEADDGRAGVAILRAMARLIEGVIFPSLAAHGIEVEPVHMFTPVMGSGRLVLAVASAMPSYAQAGVLKFHGQDLDPTLVCIAKANMHAAGLGACIGDMRWTLGNGLAKTPLPPIDAIIAKAAADWPSKGVATLREHSRTSHRMTPVLAAVPAPPWPPEV